MGNLIKFGEYTYKSDPFESIKLIINRYDNVRFLSKKYINDLELIGMSYDEFINIFDTIKSYQVKNLYDIDIKILKYLLLDLEDFQEDGMFFNIDNLYVRSGVSIESCGNSRINSYIFDTINLYVYNNSYIDIIQLIFEKIISAKNEGKGRKYTYLKNYTRAKGNFPHRKTRWFNVNILLEYEINLVGSFNNNYNSQLYNNIKSKMSDIIINYFKYKGINIIPKVEVELSLGSRYHGDNNVKVNIRVKPTF